MNQVTMYWSNICVLHKEEKRVLGQTAQRLAAAGIQLDVKYFGLGYSQKMSEYLAEPDAILPDIIVSTDLEVFENQEIFSRFSHQLYPLAAHFPVKKTIAETAISYRDTLLPFLVIPLVFCTNSADFSPQMGIVDVIKSHRSLAIGGIDNSGAKSVIKAVWSTYGKQ